MKKWIIIFPILLLCACSETPEAVPAEIISEAPSQKQLEADAKSIEQAADEAVKLIEADANAEIEANKNSTQIAE